MSRRGPSTRQDGGAAAHSAKEKQKEAAQRLFSKPAGKDTAQQSPPDAEGGEDIEMGPGGSEGVPIEQPDGSSACRALQALPSMRPGTDPSDMDHEPTLREIFSAVTTGNIHIAELAGEVKGMKVELSLVRQDMQKLRDRTAALEGRVGSLEDEWQPLQRDVKYLQTVSSANAARLEDMENRLRRNNVRAVGIPEKSEGKNPVHFIESWLLDTFGKESFSPMFAVERAHRVPARPPPPGAPPRPFLFKLLNYKDRDAILHKARTTADLSVGNARISLYPDFSAEVQRRRAKFIDIKKRLRNLNVPYYMLYPAKLKVVVNGNAQFFDNPVAAMNWLDREEHHIARQAPP